MEQMLHCDSIGLSLCTPTPLASLDSPLPWIVQPYSVDGRIQPSRVDLSKHEASQFGSKHLFMPSIAGRLPVVRPTILFSITKRTDKGHIGTEYACSGGPNCPITGLRVAFASSGEEHSDTSTRVNASLYLQNALQHIEEPNASCCV